MASESLQLCLGAFVSQLQSQSILRFGLSQCGSRLLASASDCLDGTEERRTHVHTCSVGKTRQQPRHTAETLGPLGSLKSRPTGSCAVLHIMIFQRLRARPRSAISAGATSVIDLGLTRLLLVTSRHVKSDLVTSLPSDFLVGPLGIQGSPARFVFASSSTNTVVLGGFGAFRSRFRQPHPHLQIDNSIYQYKKPA